MPANDGSSFHLSVAGPQMERQKNSFEKPVKVKGNYEKACKKWKTPGGQKNSGYSQPGQATGKNLKKTVLRSLLRVFNVACFSSS
jgi:hypothetical protein